MTLFLCVGVFSELRWEGARQLPAIVFFSVLLFYRMSLTQRVFSFALHVSKMFESECVYKVA